ncbi:RING/U-box superfamily protein [Perilla frutescens var. hirtella]|uniref:RING/U-box superfamily protein n=1 Tax=Perilla frutescens var. hirtella TaxID=608512 RepID=A0AAD4NWU0_PERFH|nr:RING/U-box superfamily protein [Perilla frutescens var. hirtella]KAH6771189.1 RING/U-box superfamily protein [Perilla frutescens var. hirtella]
MWKSISHSIRGLGQKKNIAELAMASHELSDDDMSSNASTDEGLECPICWESFNIVENVPYVLWCGHTLCKNCVMGLRLAALKFSTHQIQIPFFVSCPWCNLLTFRFLYKGNLRFPSKNFFILWMVESRNGERVKALSSICRDRQQVWTPRCTSATGNCSSDTTNRRTHRHGHPSNNNPSRYSDRFTSERLQMSFHKSLDFFIRVMAKFPLVVLLMIVTFAIPAGAAILMLYLAITLLFAVPAFLVLYFAYPVLDWLGREMRT